jgi:RNA-directed DNA polymerase
VISPLLANIYLHELDLRWHRPGGPKQTCNAHLVRYADDFVVLARNIGSTAVEFLTELLEGKMGLTLHPEKTRKLDLRQPGVSLDFLGYTFRFDRDLKGRNKRYLNMFPSKKALSRRRAAVKALTLVNVRLPLDDLILELNRSLLGWARYSSLGYPARTFHALDNYVLVRLDRFMRNRSQRRMRPPEGMTLYEWVHSKGLVRLSDPQTIKYLRGQGGLPQAYRRAG